MPANLTPDYERAEEKYRNALTDDEKLDALREMLSTIPKHKGTEKLQADLKRKMSQFRRAVARKPAKSADPFHVPRCGAGQVVLIGPPNSGKSALLARITHAPAKVADYPFTTAIPLPGMCLWEDVQIELVDTPPITPEHLPGAMLGTIRGANMLAIVVDASLDPLTDIETILGLLDERGLTRRTLADADMDPSDFHTLSAMIVANKSDLADESTVRTLRDLYAGRMEVWPVSATTGAGLKEWILRIWQLLSLVRVYTKQPGKAADNGRPFTLPIGSTIEDLAREIHRELPGKMKFARIWGDGRFSGQQVHRTEVLHDRDVVEIHE